MKKSILKTITAFILTVCLAGTLFISVACSDNNQGDNTTVSSSSPASTDSGSQSGSSSGGNPSDPTKDPVNEPKAVERDGISVQKLLGDVMDMSVYDCFELLSGNDLSVLDGLMVGDVVNLVISSIQLEVPGANVSATCVHSPSAMSARQSAAKSLSARSFSRMARARVPGW